MNRGRTDSEGTEANIYFPEQDVEFIIPWHKVCEAGDVAYGQQLWFDTQGKFSIRDEPLDETATKARLAELKEIFSKITYDPQHIKDWKKKHL